MRFLTWAAAALFLSLSASAHAQSCDSMLADFSAWQAKTKPQEYFYEIRVLMTTNSKRTRSDCDRCGWVGVADGSIGRGLTGILTQTFSDRKTQRDPLQNFDINQPDKVGITLLPGNRVELNFITWNYKSTINVTCNNGFMYGDQGQELHVFSFRKYRTPDVH